MTRALSLCFAVITLGFMGALALSAAVEWRQADLEMSDGVRVAGRVCIPKDIFYIYNDAQKRRYTINAADIRLFETVLESESMEKKWFFKEDGRDEKVYTGELYPVRYFRARVTYHDGRTLEGHIISQSMTVDADGEKRNLVLQRKVEGKVGEDVEDLVYIKRMELAGGSGGVLGSIHGVVTVPAGEKLLKVLAINTESCVITQARLDRAGGFRFEQCTRGAHDLVVVTDRTIFFSSSAENGPDGRMDAATLKEIADWASQIREFFHDQAPVYGAGDAKDAWALVRLERYGGTSLKGAELVRRYEIWHIHKPVDEWQITKRLFVSRELTGDRDDPRERIAIVPALAGHVVDAEHANLKLTLDLSSERKP